MLHENNSFLTLTYNDENLPISGALDKRHLQLFLKRLRKALVPLRIRYFAVGEYGEKSLRPHYHLTLFGLSGHQVLDGLLSAGHTGQTLVEKCWPFGFAYLGEFNEATAQYVSRYIVKHVKDRKAGRIFDVPEFATMSLRPGLGSGAMSIVAESLLKSAQSWETGDVVRNLRIGKRNIPLGRYLLSTLRDRVGFSEEYIAQIKEEATFQQSLDMLAVFASQTGSLTVTEAYKKEVQQKIKQVETRYAIWNSKHQFKDNL